MNQNLEQINLHGLRFPRVSIQNHFLISGATGSGKTHGILKPLVRQILDHDIHSPERRAGMVVFDIKGDLKPVVEEALAKCGRSNDLITVGVGDGDATFNPLGDRTLTPAQIAQQLILAASISGQEVSQRSKGEELFWATARTDVLTSLIELTQTTLRQADIQPLTLAHLQRARGLLSQSKDELKKWITVASSILSEASAIALQEWSKLPGETTRACINSSIGSVLSPWAREPLSQLVTADEKRPFVNLADIFQYGRVVVVNVAQAENAEELWPACLLLKQALYKFALARARLPINQERLVAVVIDEANRLISAHNNFSSEHVALEAARANRVAIILAVQNLSGLNAVNGDVLTDKLAALCGNQFFLANSCPATLRLAQRCTGNRMVMRRHLTLVPTLPPPQLFPENEPEARPETQVTLVPVEVPLISAAALARLPLGAGHAKLADGSVHRFQCTFD